MRHLPCEVPAEKTLNDSRGYGLPPHLPPRQVPCAVDGWVVG